MISLTSGINAQTQPNSKDSLNSDKKDVKVSTLSILRNSDTRDMPSTKDTTDTNHTSDINPFADMIHINDTIPNTRKVLVPVNAIRIANQIFISYIGAENLSKYQQEIIEDLESMLRVKDSSIVRAEEIIEVQSISILTLQDANKEKDTYYQKEISKVKKRNILPWGVTILFATLLGFSL